MLSSWTWKQVSSYGAREMKRIIRGLALHGLVTVEHLRLKASKKLPIVLSGTGLAAHLRYRRETLGLTRSEAAKRIGVRGAAVGQWETGDHQPEPEYWPALPRFIGYDPVCSDPQTVPEKIAYLCRHLGLSRNGLAARLGVNKATIYSWEAGGPQRRGRSTEQFDTLAQAIQNVAKR